MIEKTVGPTLIFTWLLRSLQMALSQHTDPNPGTHTYVITTTNKQDRHTIFSLVWRTETQMRLWVADSYSIGSNSHLLLWRNIIMVSWKKGLPSAHDIPNLACFNIEITAMCVCVCLWLITVSSNTIHQDSWHHNRWSCCRCLAVACESDLKVVDNWSHRACDLVPKWGLIKVCNF